MILPSISVERVREKAFAAVLLPMSYCCRIEYYQSFHPPLLQSYDLAVVQGVVG